MDLTNDFQPEASALDTSEGRPATHSIGLEEGKSIVTQTLCLQIAAGAFADRRRTPSDNSAASATRKREHRQRVTDGSGKHCGGLTAAQNRKVCTAMLSMVQTEAKAPTLAALAALVNLSPSYFCRAFARSNGGLAPFQWLRAQRMERAQAMMAQNPDASLLEIALSVGYQSHAAFSVAFKRETGVGPALWRREQRV